MLTWETTVEAQALYARGWTKSAIARHLWASTLFDELTALGYAGSYPSFTRALRTRRLRPHCEPCAASRGRDAGLIAHPPGAETQWDWLELPDPPAAWKWGASAHLLVGVLAHSSRWRAVLAEAEDQPQLIEAIDGVVRRLGGVSHRWRFDRMATVCYPGSGRLTATFAAVGLPDGLGAGAGRLPRQPLLGAAGVGRHDGAGRPPPRRGDVGHRRRGGGAGPTPPRARRRRGIGPRHRACGGPGEGGAGRLYRPGAVPGQGAPATVGGGVGRGRPAARCPTGTGRARRG